ncbi:hypothetical protein V6N13_120305 [Hibiscus sabdariffa]|uniref:Uncharacterized protein n=1 Tax=Hibiscus sabdariffa TaxID=183260 RepID=A0ABR2E5A0_9ROSI
MELTLASAYGSFLSNPGKAGAGDIIPNHEGHRVVGSYRHIPVATNVEAERYGTMGLRGPSIRTVKTLRSKLMPLPN